MQDLGNVPVPAAEKLKCAPIQAMRAAQVAIWMKPRLCYVRLLTALSNGSMN